MKRTNRIGSRLFIGLTFLFLYLPIFLLIVFSFNAGESSAVWQGFSLDWYRALFENRLIMESLYTTLLVSLLATVISTAAGTFAAIGLYSLGRKKRDALLVVNDIPMMNADIVTGVSLCLFFVAFFQGWGAFARWFNGVQGAVEDGTRRRRKDAALSDREWEDSAKAAPILTPDELVEAAAKLDALTGKLQALERNILQYAEKLGLTPSGRVRLAQKRAQAAAEEPDGDLFGD